MDRGALAAVHHEGMSHVPARPCKGCPWVIENDPAVIPGFDLDQAEALAGTCPDEQGMGPDFGAAMMACHHSREGEDFACAGWLAVAGDHHPAVRLERMRGQIPPEALAPRPGWPALHPDFASMIAHLRQMTPTRSSRADRAPGGARRRREKDPWPTARRRRTSPDPR